MLLVKSSMKDWHEAKKATDTKGEKNQESEIVVDFDFLKSV